VKDWDGVAYHHGIPSVEDVPTIDQVKYFVLDEEMRVFDHLPKQVRDRLNEEGGIALECVPQTGGGW
jgi:hypothetical protein